MSAGEWILCIIAAIVLAAALIWFSERVRRGGF